MSKTFHGKSLRLGGGGRFAKGVAAIEAKGMSSDSAHRIMAAQGMKKYGASKMASMAAAGRRRRHGKTNRPIPC